VVEGGRWSESSNYASWGQVKPLGFKGWNPARVELPLMLKIGLQCTNFVFWKLSDGSLRVVFARECEKAHTHPSFPRPLSWLCNLMGA
jgi:hypothetical protein